MVDTLRHTAPEPLIGHEHTPQKPPSQREQPGRCTYMVDGKQYIAMPVGNPGLQGNSALSAAPENGAVRGSKSSVLWVWELP